MGREESLAPEGATRQSRRQRYFMLAVLKMVLCRKQTSCLTSKPATEILESEMRELTTDLSNAATLCAAGDERINYLNDFFLFHLGIVNGQQDDLITSYAAQLKEIQHRADAAKALEKEALTVAQGTHETLYQQLDLLDVEIGVGNGQDVDLAHLNSELEECKEDFLFSLSSTIANLTTKDDNALSTILTLKDFVLNRKCEYGTGTVDSNTVTSIYFKTMFDHPPSVSLFLTGFHGHLDVHTYDTSVYDGLSLDKYVTNVTEHGFAIYNNDLSDGMVELKVLDCSYMACYGFEDDFA